MSTLAGWPGKAAADDQPTLKIDPPSQTVSPSQTFVVNVVQLSTVTTTGAQVDVVFDPKLLQIKDFELGPAYTSASAVFAFGSSDLGTSGSKDATIGRANRFGTLENAAGFLLPGSGTIPVGDTVFLKITFVSQSGKGGQVNLGLLRGSMIGETGNALDPHLLNGAVVVGAGGAPGAPGSPGASGEPSPSPTVVPTETPAAPVSPTTPVKVSLAPATITLEAGMPARVFLVVNADGDISSVAADLTFDKDKLEITGLEAGPAWSAATLIASASGSSRGVDGAIAEANTTGVLQAAGAFFPPGAQDLPYGEGVFVSVLVKAKVDGTSNLTVGKVTVLGVSGETIPVTIDAGSLTKPPDKGMQLDPTLVIPLVLLAVIVIAALAIVRSGRIPVRVRRRWPYYVSLMLGLIPALLFLGLVVMTVVKAAPVVTDPGIPALFGAPVINANGQPVTGYSLLPALWGTALLTFIAAGVGLPISLTLAVAAVDFPMGPIGRLVRPVIGVLSGVPPIVYAVSVPVFVTAFMIPKFAADMDFSQFQNGGPAAIGADPSTWPPAGVPYSAGGFPWDLSGPNSTLIAGLLVGLFLVPFVTPLFVDALRDVPRAAREGSFALGANRTYTLRRVVLPRALPAIAGASTLAVLKAMGDAIIVLFAAGFAAQMPTPPFDVLERAASVGSWGTNLIGSLDTLDASCNPTQCALGYTSALVLLLVAAVVVLVLTYLQVRGRRRLAA